MTKYAGVTGDILTQAVVQTLLTAGDGESCDDLTKLAIKDQSGAGTKALQLLVTETLAADRTLTLTVGTNNRAIALTGDLTLAGNLTTTGAYNLTLALGATVTITLPSTSQTLVGLTTSDIMTNKTLTAPDINGGTADALTSLGIRSTGAAYDLKLATTAVYTGDRTLTITIPTTGNAALTLVGNLITAGGAFGLTLTMSGDTNVTVPTTGTLATTGVTTLASLVSAAALATVGTIGTGVWQGTPVAVAYGGTGLSTLTDHGVVLGSGTAAVSITSAGTAGQPLLSAGAAADPDWGTLGVAYGGTGAATLAIHGVLLGQAAGAITALAVGTTGKLLRCVTASDPAWSTLTMPDTIGINEIFYASSANVLGVIAAANSSILVTGGTGVPSLATDIPTAVTIGAAYITRVGGTDVTLADGGTGASLTAANGGIVWSTASAMAILAAGSAGQLLRSGGAATPTWTTLTIPATIGVNELFYASSANVLAAIAAANSSVLVTGGTGVPAFATDIPTAVTIGTAYITRVGGTDVTLADGGTNASLTAANGGIVWSTASALAILAAGSAGQALISGGAATPAWTTTTYPATVAAGDLLHASVANVIGGITAVATGQVLCSAGASTVPAWSATPTFTSSVQTGRGEVGILNFKDDTEVTLDANGEATVTQSYHRFDTNADGASDDLEAIIGGAEGDILIFRADNAGRTIVAKHAGTPTTGKAMNLAAGVDFTMDEDDDFLMLLYDGALWQEIGRSENHA